MGLFVPIENLVEEKHPYRLIKDLVNFESVRGVLDGCIKEINSKYTLVQGPRFIKRNNMKEKDKDLDRYLTKLRTPYERVFSKENKVVRDIGRRKTLFAALMQSIAFNCKRLLRIRDQIPKDFVLSAG